MQASVRSAVAARAGLPAEQIAISASFGAGTTSTVVQLNLPAATKMIREMPDGKVLTMYDRGYPLGFIGSTERTGSVAGTPYIYNHLRFVIKFHREDSFTGSRIVGFEVGVPLRPNNISWKRAREHEPSP